MLTGFDPVASAVEDFVTLVFKSEDRTDLRVNADGEGTDFQMAAAIYANLGGTTAADLYSSGHLILDQKIFTSDA